MFAKRKILILTATVLLVAVAGYAVYAYLYHDARNISAEEAALTINAATFAKEYSDNIKKADSIYLNRTIAVEGVVTAAENLQITLDSVVFCGFDKLTESDLIGKHIKVKGRCIGYDELFNEIKLDQCTIVE